LLLLQGTAELAPFDPFNAQPKMSYKDGYQKRYFVLDSFQVRARYSNRNCIGCAWCLLNCGMLCVLRWGDHVFRCHN
jgi:hypothetical protein